MVDHDDVVGEAVGLFEILGGEQQRGAVGDELLDHAPQASAALRVETRGRLVEEEHRRAVHERGGEVEPAPHAPAVGASGPVGGVDEIEALEELVGAGTDRPRGEVREQPDHLQVLVAGEVLVDGGVLAGETDLLAYGLRIPVDGHSEHFGETAVVAEDGREDPHRRGLAGAVGAEQAEDRAGGHREIDAGQRDDGTKPLFEVFDSDGVFHVGQPRADS